MVPVRGHPRDRAHQGRFIREDRAVARLRLAQGGNTFISASPRYAMEGLGMTLLAVTYVPAFSLWLPGLLK